MKTALLVTILALVLMSGLVSARSPPPARAKTNRAALAARVREELLFSWQAYEKHA